MKARAGLPVPPYESAEQEDSELYVDEPGCVEIPTVQPTTLLNSAVTNEVLTDAALLIMLLEVAETDKPELETHSTLCKLMRTQAERKFIAGICEDPRDSSDAEIAARAEAGIRAQLPTFSAPLPTVTASAIIRPPRQRRYINEELRTANQRKHEVLLATVARLGLPGGDVEAFAFLGSYEMRLYGQVRSVQLIKDVF